MASIQDTERQCAAMLEKAVKEADKVRADAHATAAKLLAQAEKDAQTVRDGAVDEQIRKLMAQSPRRVELLQEIKGLERRKGELKGELEAHEKQCLADRKAILRDGEKILDEAARRARAAVDGGLAKAKGLVMDAEAYILHKAEEKARSEQDAAEAQRKAADARAALGVIFDQIGAAKASLDALEARRYVLRNEEANQRNRLAKILGGLEDA